MRGLRHVALTSSVGAPLAAALLIAGASPPAVTATGAGTATGTPVRALPETVVINDSRSSAPVVDISRVTINASWYWDSDQSISVKVPHGLRPGHRLTVWFDVDGDSTPDGHYALRLREPRKAGGKVLRKVQEFRLGGGWNGAGELVRCTSPDGFRPAAGEIRRGQRDLGLAMDLWWCLKRPNPQDSGAWRVAVRLAKGKDADMAPNGRRWSEPVAGWGPCDPSGGACP